MLFQHNKTQRIKQVQISAAGSLNLLIWSPLNTTFQVCILINDNKDVI